MQEICKLQRLCSFVQLYEHFLFVLQNLCHIHYKQDAFLFMPECLQMKFIQSKMQAGLPEKHLWDTDVALAWLLVCQAQASTSLVDRVAHPTTSKLLFKCLEENAFK